MLTQNFLMLLMLMLRNASKILKLNFGHNSDAEVISIILKLNFGQVFRAEFGQDFEADAWSRL